MDNRVQEIMKSCDLLFEEYDNCSEDPETFKRKCVSTVSSAEGLLKRLSILQFNDKKIVQQTIQRLKETSDYKNRFNDRVQELSKEYISQGIGVTAAKDIINIINRTIVNNKADTGLLSFLITPSVYDYPYILLRTQKDQYLNAGIGPLGHMSFDDQDLVYEDYINTYECGLVAYITVIAKYMKDEPLPSPINQKYASEVTISHNYNDRPFLWLYSTTNK